MLFKRDEDAVVHLASLASSSVAGHAGVVIGKVLTMAAAGLTGSWLVVLLPLASGYGGHVTAKTLAKRLRYRVFCRDEVATLKRAIGRCCVATRWRHPRAGSSTAATACIDDWLNRQQQLQALRRLHRDRLHRASPHVSTLDPQDGDVVEAAPECLKPAGRVGSHPANVTGTTAEATAAARALHRRLQVALI